MGSRIKSHICGGGRCTDSSDLLTIDVTRA